MLKRLFVALLVVGLFAPQVDAANFVFNKGKGRLVELANRVTNNDPTNSAFIVVVLSVTGDQDAALTDADTMAAVEALANVAEVTNTNYGRKTVTTITVTEDDTNNRTDVDFADQTWTSVAAGDAWTDLIVCYDPDTTTGTDADLIPLCSLDLIVTPDGSNIQATFNAAGLMRAE